MADRDWRIFKEDYNISTKVRARYAVFDRTVARGRLGCDFILFPKSRVGAYASMVGGKVIPQFRPLKMMKTWMTWRLQDLSYTDKTLYLNYLNIPTTVLVKSA